MNIQWKLLSALLLFFFVTGAYFCSVHYTVAQTDSVGTKLQAANIAVEQGFSAVLGAEKAGINVTDLVNQLNNAADLLAQAENAYRTGNNITATEGANAVLTIAQQVAVTAQTLKGNASVSPKTDSWSSIALTSIVAFAFILVMFLIWRLFKRHYVKNLLNAKPEVIPK